MKQTLKGANQMKASRKTIFISVAATLLTLTATVWATQKVKDPTKYDYRVVVGYRIVNTGTKPPLSVPIYGCPHKDKLAAGKCETSWIWGMRCKE